MLRAVSSFAKGNMGITSSIGWAVYPDDGVDFASLFARADQALHTAKRSGKNTYMFFNDRIADEIRKDFEIRRTFSEAVWTDRIEFFLQPKGDCVKGKVYGAEMLVRWKKEGGYVPPYEFIHSVEKDQTLIRELGRRGLKEASRLREKFERAGFPLRISLNIGAKHFLSPFFIRDVDEMAGNGKNIIIEITESSIIENIEKTTFVVNELKKRGFQISLDDFGTGYSSLIHASKLPVDEIKLDRDFIRDFRKNVNAFAVAGSTIVLGSLSQRFIVAEGIETMEELELWMRMGGRYVQGYYIARPMPEEKFSEWLENPSCTCGTFGRFDFEDLVFLKYVFMDTENADVFAFHGNSDNCRLTRWFDERRKIYGHLGSFMESERLHAEMHALKDDTGGKKKELFGLLHRALLELYADLSPTGK